jgi:Crp-like helix-turn-helix domain
MNTAANLFQSGKPMNATDLSGSALLSQLRPDDLALFVAEGKLVSKPVNFVLYEPGQHVERVYFPLENTLVSYVVDVEGAHAVETAMVGREGAVGGIVSQGKLPAYTRIMVQAGGNFAVVPLQSLEKAKAQSMQVANLFARYADCLMAQIFQSVACNASHTVEQRAAKWIVASIERTGANPLPLTQERLAAMLGVGRSYMSRVIQRFKAEQILSVRRGHIFVTDAGKLSRKACNCNTLVQNHFETVLKGVYPET